MTDADDYENLAVEQLQQARARPFTTSWQGALAQAVSGLGWAVLAHMKREEERDKVELIELRHNPVDGYVKKCREDKP
jgi:hypothetical protein